MSQYQTQITIPSLFNVYLQELIDAGALQLGNCIGLHSSMRKHLSEVHRDVAAGDNDIFERLEKQLDRALSDNIIVAGI